jgi:hypothetical protein
MNSLSIVKDFNVLKYFGSCLIRQFKIKVTQDLIMN